MQQWEYLTIVLDSAGSYNLISRWISGQELRDWKKGNLSAVLSQLGRDCWEMVGTLTVSSYNYATLFFKRPL